MKHEDPKKAKKNNFLRIPLYPGGKAAFRKFIADNIVYPEHALSNNVEGSVFLVYSVNNIGKIENIVVKKGIGYGCDEEAARVIGMLHYKPARNRGIRLKVEMKTKIYFKLSHRVNTGNQADVKINYISTKGINANSPEPERQAVYSYMIDISSKTDNARPSG